jgi:hypothetical protein
MRVHNRHVTEDVENGKHLKEKSHVTDDVENGKHLKEKSPDDR